jgi:hemerythrin-like metal-binding protein
LNFSELKIRQKLWLGFGSVVFLGLIFAAYSFIKMKEMDFYAQRIVNLRTPTVKASTSMMNNINSSQSALQGWMLLADESFKAERVKAWLEIRAAEKEMSVLSPNWTVPKNIERFNKIKSLLNQYNYYQTQIEELPDDEAFTENKIALFENNLTPINNQLIEILEAMVENQHGLLQTDGFLINQELTDFLYQLAFATFIVVIFSLLLIYATSKDITRPILEIVDAMERVAMGDFKAIPDAPDPTDKSETARLKLGLRQMVSDIEQVLLILEASKKEAEEANEAKTQFLDNMNHELRTPLNSIIGFSDLILSGAGGELKPESYKEYIKYIHNSGEHLLELINDMLDMSKIEAGKLDLTLEFIDAESIIRDCFNMVQVRISEKNLKFSIHIPDNMPKIEVDVRALRQILLNLLTNAIKFTNSGGNLSISITIDKNNYKFCIEDSGRGMDEEGVVAAMEPFVQVVNKGDRAHEGTGLGLPLCKNLVELHRGKFWLESELGKGTKAIFTIPKKISTKPSDFVKNINKDVRPTLYWKRDMSVGIEHFDQEHKALFSLTYQMARLNGQSKMIGVMLEILESLESYSEHHFSSEERLMDEMSYPDYLKHRAEHDHFRKWLAGQKAKFKKGPKSFDSEECAEYLVGWLNNHIMKSDKKYDEFFKTKPTEVSKILKNMQRYTIHEDETIT